MDLLHGLPCKGSGHRIYSRQAVLQHTSASYRYLARNFHSERTIQCNRLRRKFRGDQYRSYICSASGMCRSSWSCKGHRHVKISQQAPLPRGIRAVQTSDVEAESSIDDVKLHGEQNGTAEGYGISVSDLQRFAELAPHEVFAPKTGFFVSAAHLATLLHTSLSAGVSGGRAELAARRQALGSNSLPERDQVCLQCLHALICSSTCLCTM